jgi:hypothetical protein
MLEHHETSLEIFVSKSRVSAKIASGPQKSYITWSGNPELLGRSSEFPLVSAGKIGLSSKDAACTFHPTLSPLGNEPLATANPSNKSTSKIPATASALPPASAVKGAETAHAKSPESPSATGETSKLPIPTTAELAKAHEELREAFGDFEDMPEKKGYWAREFIAVANSEKNVAVSYVMLDTARRLAIDAQDLKMAIEATNKMCQKFQIDDMRLYLDTLKLTTGKTIPFDKREEFTIYALMLSSTAVNNRRSDIAIEGSQLAVELAAKGRSQDLRNQAEKSLELALEYKKSEGLLAAAMQRLANDPNDPEANLFTGKWYSLVLGDFGKGLPYLSKGGDPLLAKAAQTEQQPGVKEIAVADAWFEAGRKLSGSQKIAALKRSREFYGRARANSSGLEQLRAEKRGSEVQKAIDDAEKEKTGRPKRP